MKKRKAPSPKKDENANAFAVQMKKPKLRKEISSSSGSNVEAPAAFVSQKTKMQIIEEPQEDMTGDTGMSIW